MRRCELLLIVLAFVVSCATPTPPVAATEIDWAAADERWSIHVVTVDADGRDRVTRIWMALLDGQGVFRTNDSRWWENLERGSNLRVRHDAHDYVFRVEAVTNVREKARVDEAFLAKFGRWERMLFPQPRGETHTNYGRLLR